ncbi:hypothetical protein [Bacillus sp. SD088]|uniref:hypothetical protein n=1 Tax=Bacillus sp. SD088 TaxID=2782012 RepID=UPI001A976CDE|nr:hypothetical protein [Bacillus sp. SD088]MBO0991518.1 hypothetical protein [Bacillus sp. SD088]
MNIMKSLLTPNLIHLIAITNSLQNDSSAAGSLIQGVVIRAIIYTIVVLIMIQMKKEKTGKNCISNWIRRRNSLL